MDDSGSIKLNGLKLFDRLMHDILTRNRITQNVMIQLESNDFNKRREIVNQTKDECTPLFLSAQRGLMDMVNYLITVCGADIEKKGQCYIPGKGSKHSVTPLWCAVGGGKVDVVKTLVQHGALINCVSDTGSTPVRIACLMSNIDMVKYLVESGADIMRPSDIGGTCLINSIQNVELCQFLINCGANVNAYDIQFKTALHYAIQENLLEATKCLLHNGADPYARTRYRDDALQIACLKGNVEIFDYLIKNVEYDNKRRANAYELLGTTFLDEIDDRDQALRYWNHGLMIRATDLRSLAKPRNIKPRTAFLKAVEFDNLEQLKKLAESSKLIHMQSLLICDRVLGSLHKDTILRIRNRGLSYNTTNLLKINCCIDLWNLALRLSIKKYSVLHCESYYTAEILLRVCVELFEKNNDSNILRFVDILRCIKCLTKGLEEAVILLNIRPVFNLQIDIFYKILKMYLYFLHICLNLPKTESCYQELEKYVSNIMRLDLRNAHRSSLLHLSVCQGWSALENHNQTFFPSLSVTRLLLQCGANVDAKNKIESTPLHEAGKPENFNIEILQSLLDYGAHVDFRNQEGELATTALLKVPNFSVNVLNYLTLKCLAAKIVIKYKLKFKGEVPESLERFINCH